MTTTLAVSFTVDDVQVDAVNIRDLAFATYYGYASEAQKIKGITFDAAMRRMRMIKQVDYMLQGKKVDIKPEQVLKIPLAAARKIFNSLDSGDAIVGKVLEDGDGISTVIRYQLGTPIALQNAPPIAELEFLASTYGEVEDVLSAADQIEQTLALLRTVAKPVHQTLMSLPSWAVDRISIADGVTMTQKVLPKFLGDSEPTA